MNMAKIFTQEDRNFLKSLCRYLGSYGLTDGSVEIYIDPEWADHEELISSIDSFIGNGRDVVEVPERYKEILLKIFSHISGLKPNVSSDLYLTNEEWEITVDCKNSKVYTMYIYTYVETTMSQVVYNLNSSPKSLSLIFNILDKTKKDDILVLKYDGRDEEREIENSFTNGRPVPSKIIDWCFDTLDNDFSGWSYELGGKGTISFNLKTKEITIDNEEYEEIHDSKRIWFEKF